MAPEQATFNAVDVDTRADVYSLGVILYELLTGTTPITRETVKKVAFDEMLKLVREQDAPRPSTRLSTTECKPDTAVKRNVDSLKLSKLVKGDLDCVVLKALEKDRNRRYQTSAGLAADVQRYLDRQPVQAVPPSAAYHLRKFVRRNRMGVLAASVLALALVGGIAGTTWGLILARRQKADAENARTAETERVVERDAALGKAETALRQEAQRVTERDAAVKVADERAADLNYRLGISNFVLANAAYENRDVILAAERLEAVPAAAARLGMVFPQAARPAAGCVLCTDIRAVYTPWRSARTENGSSPVQATRWLSCGTCARGRRSAN